MATRPASFVLLPHPTDIEVVADREEELQALFEELNREEDEALELGEAA